jgi:hypothetical protein
MKCPFRRPWANGDVFVAARSRRGGRVALGTSIHPSLGIEVDAVLPKTSGGIFADEI